jgi:hypothetical protein
VRITRRPVGDTADGIPSCCVIQRRGALSAHRPWRGSVVRLQTLARPAVGFTGRLHALRRGVDPHVERGHQPLLLVTVNAALTIDSTGQVARHLRLVVSNPRTRLCEDAVGCRASQLITAAASQGRCGTSSRSFGLRSTHKHGRDEVGCGRRSHNAPLAAIRRARLIASPVLSSRRSWSCGLQRASRTALLGCIYARRSTPRIVRWHSMPSGHGVGRRLH